MLLSRKTLAITGCVAFLCGGLLLAANVPGKAEKDKEKGKAKSTQTSKADKKGAEKKSEAKKDVSDSKDGEKQPSKLVIPLPKGQDSKGVIIPYTDGSGKKSLVFKIGVGTKVDDSHVKMSDLLIETFDESGTQEMTIKLPSSVLDMSTRTITGDQSVTIDRSDFQITGKNMEFQYETRKGWIKGDVKMIIYDLNEEDAAATPGDSKPASSNPNPKGS
jgi:hypothetical protein